MTADSTTSTHAQFVGSIPETYDTCLGPFLFEFAARDLAIRVAQQLGSRGELLEVACGTGISTEHLRDSLAVGVHIVATDLNQAMLDYATTVRGQLTNVEFAQADALDLPYEDASFDAVVCQFGLMFFPDKRRGLQQMMRVLKPGGTLFFNVWDSLQRNPAIQIAASTIAAQFSDNPPQFLETPFGFHSIDHIRDLLAQIGCDTLSVHTVSEVVEQADPMRPARGLVQGNPGLLEIQQRANSDAETITQAVCERLVDAYGPAPLAIPLREIVFSVSKPATG